MREIQAKNYEAKNHSYEIDSELSVDNELEKLLGRQIWITNQLRSELFELTQKNKYDSIINSVVLSIYRSRNINEIFENVVDSIFKIVESIDYVAVFKVQNNIARLAASSGFEEKEVISLQKASNKKGLIWKSINENKTLVCDDISEEKSISAYEKLLGINSYISAPIQYSGRAHGSIMLASKEKYIADKHKIKLVETVSLQLEIALKYHFQEKKLIDSQTELKKNLDQLSKKNRYEAIINAITQSVHQSIELKNVLDNAVVAMSKNIENVNNVSIYFVENGFAVLQAHKGYPEWFVEKVAKIPKPKGLTWKTIIDERSRYVEDISNDDYIGPAGRKVGTKSYASMPINFKGRTIGSINLSSHKINAFDHDEIMLLEIVSKQIGSAINNATQAELLKKANDKLETRVEERTKTLSETNEKLKIEITERKKIEEEIKNSLREKEVLLMEIHHRVKNNLQIITSLLNLQSNKIKDQELLKVFNDSKSRIKSMSILHEHLYRSNLTNKIDLKKYLEDLSNHISRSNGSLGKDIELKIIGNGAMIDINKAIPCGLIVNELVSNAYEHGFNNKASDGIITIEFIEKNSKCLLSVNNNGSKLPDNFNINESRSLGLQLVISLTNQLNGKLKINNCKGAEFTIEFSA